MNSNAQLALIICGAIGAAFLVLALVLIFASLASRDKKVKVVAAPVATGFFAATEGANLRPSQRTNAMQASQYADLTDLPGEGSSQGVQSIKPLSHTELLGQLNDDDEERP